MINSTLIASTTHLVKGVLKRTPLRRLRRGRFRGQYASHAEALQAVRPGTLGGYDHREVVDVAYREMCEVKHWDYPILFWLERLLATSSRIVDAGGHMGTKYRAFRSHLRLDRNVEWIVYDLPAMVRAGRELAREDRIEGLRFVDTLSEVPAADILLASGLLQYLDIPLSDLLRALPRLPPHVLLNKVATRDGDSIYLLEDLSAAEVPYQVRDRREVPRTLTALGYAVVDEWTIPSLSDAISTAANCGAVTSRGYYARLK